MSKYFGKHQLGGDIKANPGIDFITIDIPFVPDYIKVDFQGAHTNDDEIFWDLTKVDATSYQLDIAWSVYAEKHLYYRVAKLLVDPV